MLLDSAAVSCDDVRELAESCGGVAIPAHIDRDANSMLRILGDVPEAYRVVELSTRATDDEREYWTQRKTVLTSSDSHVLDTVSEMGEIELGECTVSALIRALRSA